MAPGSHVSPSDVHTHPPENYLDFGSFLSLGHQNVALQAGLFQGRGRKPLLQNLGTAVQCSFPSQPSD